MKGTEVTASSAGRHLPDAVTEMRHPFVVLDPDERLLAWNGAYADLHRNEDGTCVLRAGMTFAELTAWRRRANFFRVSERRGAAGDTRPGDYQTKGEVTHQLRDGRWMFVDRYALSDGTNIGIWIDITASKRAEEQLRATADKLTRSQEQLSRAQRIAQIGSDERDFETDAVIWSDETYRIFGVSRDSFTVTRENVLGLIHPDDRPTMANFFGQSVWANAPSRHEFRIVRPDGAVRTIVRESVIVHHADGKPLRRIGTFQDVTELRAREKLERVLQQALRAAKDEAEAAAHALEAANGDLERRVEERTRQLTAAQNELLKKERLSAIGQLTAIVAHELRNPLSAIRNTLFAMKAIAETSPVIGRSVARMERSVDRCSQIITELLDYSRVRNLECEERCFDKWLAGVVEEQQIPERVAVVRDLQAGEARVAFDPNRFRRVIINLVENAAQALAAAEETCPDGTITLRTRLADEQIEITVEDNGPGIPPENVERIFEPLFSTKSFGTGLGLPMVKQIIEQHGGTIELTSTPGAGARFLVTIPLHRRAQAA